MLRSRMRVAAMVVGGCVGVSAVAFGGSIGTGADVGRAAERADVPHQALLISDSAWLGIKTYGAVDAIQGFDHMLDLASCRRRVSRSCTNYDGHVPIPLYDEVAWRRGSFDTLVVATGYNDSDHNFRSDVDAIVALGRANGYGRIVWLTLRSNVTYRSPGDAGNAGVFQRNNDALRELASGDYPEIVIADWATYSRDRPEWFSSDGIHLRNDGPWAAADYISRKLAFLDERACPEPITPGVAVQTPCPDPDAGPPTVDLQGVYPIGEPNPTAGFRMEWEGTSSWPEPPWWHR